MLDGSKMLCGKIRKEHQQNHIVLMLIHFLIFVTFVMPQTTNAQISKGGSSSTILKTDQTLLQSCIEKCTWYSYSAIIISLTHFFKYINITSGETNISNIKVDSNIYNGDNIQVHETYIFFRITSLSQKQNYKNVNLFWNVETIGPW